MVSTKINQVSSAVHNEKGKEKQMNQDTLIRLPSGCWAVAGNSNSLFAANYFEKFPFHPLAAQARAILQAEKTGKQIRITPLSVHNLKGK